MLHPVRAITASTTLLVNTLVGSTHFVSTALFALFTKDGQTLFGLFALTHGILFLLYSAFKPLVLDLTWTPSTSGLNPLPSHVDKVCTLKVGKF